MKRKQIVAALLAALVLGGGTAEAGELVEQRAVIGGTVQSVVTTGASVAEGDVLAEVDTLAGPVPAAKASVDGTIREVRAEKGQDVRRGDVIALLESRS